MHTQMHMLMMLVPLFAIVFAFDLVRIRARREQKAVADRADYAAGPGQTPIYDRGGDSREAALHRLEPAVFRAAARLGGVLTLSDVVLETDLPVDASRTLLERMTDGEHVRMEVTDRGRVEFHFPEIRTRRGEQEPARE